MPSELIRDILDPDLAIALHKEDIELACSLLGDIINDSTWVFQRCQHSAQGDVDEDIPVLMIYLQMLEMADGVRVLLSQSCSVASVPLTRSLFESILSIEYILQDETESKERSYAWLVGYIHAKLARYQTLDQSTQKGKEFTKTASSDPYMQEIVQSVSSNQADVHKAITNLQQWLQKPHLQPFESKYQSLGKPRYWPQLSEGPANRRALAQYLEVLHYYDILYPFWSGASHGEDLSYRLTRTEGELAFHPIRSSGGISIKECAFYTVTFMMQARRLMLRRFRPGEEESQKQWYLSEIKERYDRLAGR